MATTINADTVTGGLIVTGDATGELALQAGGTTVVTVDSTGASLGDSKKILLGDGDDLQLYHDGSNSYIKDNGTGQLVLDGNAVILQYASSTKLNTTSGGVAITGALTASTATIAGLSFPSSDGSNGQAILTDGSGNLSFGAAGISTGKAIAMAIVFG